MAKSVKSRSAAKKNRSTSKRTKRTKRKSAKPRAKRAARRSAEPEEPSEADQVAYVETLIETGQAAPLTEDGKLPAGATHKIVEDDQGRVKAVRRRFSIT